MTACDATGASAVAALAVRRATRRKAPVSFAARGTHVFMYDAGPCATGSWAGFRFDQDLDVAGYRYCYRDSAHARSRGWQC